MISVHIAASSPVMRAGLEAVVRSNPGLALTSADSMDHLEKHLDDIPADVLLIATPRLTDDWIAILATAAIPAVILTSIEDSASFSAALRAGVRAVLSADASPGEIGAAVAGAAAGLITMRAASFDLLNQEARQFRDDSPADPLTPREIEVLALLAEGHSNKLIAQSLGISEHTVKFHVAAIMGKLHAGSRTDAVMQGIRRGLIMI